MRTSSTGPESGGTDGAAGQSDGHVFTRLGVSEAVGDMAPGAALAAALEAVGGSDPRAWDAASAVAVVQGIWRQTAHLHALQARVLAAMTAMDEYTWCAAPGGPESASEGASEGAGISAETTGADVAGADVAGASGRGVAARARTHVHDAAAVVASEVSAAVRISRGYARALVADAVALVEDAPATWEALSAGEIDAAKARRICERTNELLAFDEASIDRQAVEAAEQDASPRTACVRRGRVR